jgi:pilus assembly protein CpaF
MLGLGPVDNELCLMRHCGIMSLRNKKEKVMKKIFGPIQEIYNRPGVTEMIIDKFDDVYWEESGKIEESQNLFKNEGEILNIIENILGSVNRTLSSVEGGFVDLRLEDGTRVAITLPPLSIDGPSMVIRKPVLNSISAKDLIEMGAINEEGWKICQKLMKKGKNTLLAGNAGCGKTTMANILISEIDKEWRVVTVEKVAELDTMKRKRTLRLETMSGKQAEMGELILKSSLLRADTLVVNEIIGPEAFEAIKLMREGYSILATISAEAVTDALKKCELFCLMGQYGLGVEEVKYHVSSGVDVIIYAERLKSGKRVISNISLVEDLDEKGRYKVCPRFTYDETSESFFTTPAGKKIL